MNAAERRLSIYQAVELERLRQETLLNLGKFKWTCADSEVGAALKLAVLVEEVGEAGRATLGESGAVGDGGNLREELVQVAAVAVAWLESLPFEGAS
jgi:NTP pyrophosphatase (non-canonical NTP hydrolase)